MCRALWDSPRLLTGPVRRCFCPGVGPCWSSGGGNTVPLLSVERGAGSFPITLSPHHGPQQKTDDPNRGRRESSASLENRLNLGK